MKKKEKKELALCEKRWSNREKCSALEPVQASFLSSARRETWRWERTGSLSSNNDGLI